MSTSSSIRSSNRPKLTPKAPSQQRTRSPSPTRKQLAQLENPIPPIRIRQPGKDTPNNPQIRELRAALGKDLGIGSIPTCLRDQLQDADPYAFEDIPDVAFDESQRELTEDILKLWKDVQEIHDRAKKCLDRRKDENAWTRLCWDVMNLAIQHAGSAMLEVNGVQTQSIATEMLPVHVSGLPVAKKAYLAFAFTPDDAQIESSYTNFAKSQPGVAISHLQDAYTRGIAVAYAVEVKEPSGDQSQASMQLAVFHAALLRKLESLVLLSGGTADCSAIPPLLGWTVVGHEWRSYITSLLDDGSIICQGPFDHLQASTGSHRAIFVLIELLKRSCSIMETSLWPRIMRVLQAASASQL